MLPSLRHRTVVGGDHQHGDIDPTDARQHVADESLVSRHIDHAHLATAGQREPGEAEVDGHLALLLFDEAVRVDPGQGADKRRLAMIDMTRRSNHITAVWSMWCR